jgi:hypothetical protein
MNQKENILASYKGKNPIYIPVTDNFGRVTGYEKIQKGVPFVRLDEE